MRISTKLLAGLAIFVLLLGVSSQLANHAFANTPTAEIEKAKAMLEAKATAYLKDIGREAIKDTTKSNYGEFKTVTLKGPDRDRQADIEKEKLVSEAKAKAVLESQTHEAIKDTTKSNYGEFKTVTLKGPDRDRQADIEKEKLVSEAKAKAVLESQTHEAIKSLKKKF